MYRKLDPTKEAGKEKMVDTRIQGAQEVTATREKGGKTKEMNDD
jgi:hypothetical protein